MSLKHRITGRAILDERVTAYHEAGHAVIGDALGLRVSRVALADEESDDCGETTYGGALLTAPQRRSGT